MKMFRYLLSLFALVAVFSAGVLAQSTSDNATVTASATLVSSITAANEANLNFGDILTTDTPAIAATDANAGYISVTGATGGQTINVSITFPSTLDNAEPSSINFGTYSAAYTTNGTEDATQALELDGANLSGQVLTGSYVATASQVGYIFVGGQITNASGGTSGLTYSNDITVSVDYN